MKGLYARIRNNNIPIIKVISIILIFIGLFLYILTLQKYSIRQNIIVIGTLSEQMDSINVSLGVNHLLSGDNAQEAYKTGISALEQSGYANTYIGFFVKQFRNLSIVFLGFIFVVTLQYIMVMRHKKTARTNEVQELVKWINLDSAEQPPVKYAPKAVISSIGALKNRIKRQEAIHEEDAARIMHYMEDIAHQLKTPLAVIRVACERISICQPNTTDTMEACLTQVDKMTNMIQDLLQLGRFDCNKQRLRFEYVNARDLIETVANDLDCLAKQKELVVSIYGKKEITWFCDVFWMKETLGNILKNCIEHSANGEIAVTYESNVRMNKITIEDCGTGFQNGCDQMIFERYSFGDRTSKEGAGLGMSIAQQAMKQHFGSISAENRPSGGVKFYISFPCLDSESIYRKNSDV
jgi:signal transduction histidine kinase